MPGNQDANIKLLYVVDENSFFTADTVDNGAAFDVIANVEIGKDLMEVVSKENLFVSVVNLSQSTVLQQQSLENVLTPVANPDPLNQELRIKVSGGWTANEGDVIEAVATYKVTAGVYTDYSSARSGTVVVSA
ncbi:hypothetical protein ODJ79_19685 [Actinoplanes sp. KI2]|uniref:hypothetical protein n=1 Tax=Actinoplanes sp. KI2 TaxID=2983315 RepID=UPI0021D61314|nr:hypothetical protein [Actinoplanes sp. KI2]MCU7725954.1 hypothetical protein [Actinoplanes sp. KI2]